MEESRQPAMTAVDRIADGNGLQMMKAAIPYFPLPLQKSLSLYIKCMEIGNVLSYYNHPVQACSAPSESDPEEILNDIMHYGTKTQQQSLEQSLNLLHTLKMYQACKDIL